MPDLQHVLSASRRNFVIVAHRARSDGEIYLNDLCGASGRWDGVSRSITSSLFLSHDMRRDTSVHILLLGPADPPKLLSVNGEKVKYLNPDERASSALMKKCLKEPLGKGPGASISPSPGITLTRVGLDGFLDSISGPLILLDEDGDQPGELFRTLSHEERFYFLLSDDMDLTEEEKDLIKNKEHCKIKLGPRVLHSQMAVSIAHFLLDIGLDPEIS